MRRQTIFWGCVAILLLIQLLLLVTSSLDENQTIDEGVHLAAGFSYWKTSDFRMNPEHPPLAKLIASVPLLFTRIHLPTDHPSWSAPDEWAFARQFLYHNSLRAETILLLGRLPIMGMTIALGFLIALWSWKIWGISGSLLSLTLYVFDTTVLAHGRYVTTDIPLALFLTLTLFFFWKFVERPTWKRCAIAALFFALAQVTKFSAIILVPILAGVWLLKYLKSPAEDRAVFCFRNACAAALLFLAITSSIIFFAYFRELRTPLSDQQFASTYYSGVVWDDLGSTARRPAARFIQRLTDPATTSGSFIQKILERIPVPAYSYFRGLSQVTWHNYWGHASYLLGMHATTGWWYYFPVALLVKSPLATMLLLLITFAYLVRLTVDRLYRPLSEGAARFRTLLARIRSTDDAYILLCAPILVLLLSSMASHLNLGVRHILPMFPFFFLLAGSLGTIRLHRFQALWRAVLITMTAGVLVQAGIMYPNFLASFSTLVGGPAQGARYLTDSNLDWGQDLRRMQRWLDDRNIPFVYITYFGQTPMEYYLKDFRYLPRSGETDRIAELNGWAAISATPLFGSDEYAWLRARTPDAKVGYSLFLYDLRKTSR